MELGAKIKELRLKNQLTQEELADRCELTKGYISQIENDLTSPTVTTLEDILKCLGSSFSEFFINEEGEQVAFRKDEQFEKEAADHAIRWLVPTAQKNAMEPILMTVKKGGSSGQDFPHDGEEFGYVIEGEITLVLGKREFGLKKGDTFYFRSSKTHYIKNDGIKDAKIVWVSSPPNF